MAKVQPMAAHLQTITAPAPLRSLPGWLIWRYEHTAGEAKPRKIPYYSTGARRFGVQGSPKDRAALVSFDVAKRTAAMRGFDGVGLALLDDFGITALDFDDCVGAEGLNSQVEAMLAGTYAEFSPSGKGVRAFVAGDLGNRKSFANATQFGFETFHSKGFVTFTGIPLEITEMTGSENVIAQPSAAVKALHAARFSASNTEYSAEAEPIIGLTEDQLATCLAALSPDMPHDEWLHVGMGLHHETCGDGFELWDTWSSQGTGYPGREALEHRWLSFGQSDVRPVTARSLVRKAEAAGAPISIDTAAASEFHVIPEQPAPPGGYFNIRSAGDFVQSVQPITWLIKGFLPKATLGVLYGESGSGKSFLAFDFCAALGRGQDWNGLRGHQARVLYVVAEGVGGFNNRVRAYCHQAGIPASAIGIDIISDVTPNLLDSGSVTRLIADIKAAGPYDLIVMDTFAQVTPGANENSGEDMGKALAYCRKINQSSGAMVLLVHHTGKDASKGARGWSGTKGASDVMLEVSRFENERCVTVEKMKDGQGEGKSFGFKLHDVVLGRDEDGDDITSCIVEYGQTSDRKPRRANVKLGDNEHTVLGVLHDLVGLDAAGQVQYEDLLTAVKSQMPYDPEKRDQRSGRALKAIQSLQSKGLIAVGESENGSFVQILREASA
jgi:hypothetical protein